MEFEAIIENLHGESFQNLWGQKLRSILRGSEGRAGSQAATGRSIAPYFDYPSILAARHSLPRSHAEVAFTSRGRFLLNVASTPARRPFRGTARLSLLGKKLLDEAPPARARGERRRRPFFCQEPAKSTAGACSKRVYEWYESHLVSTLERHFSPSRQTPPQPRAPFGSLRN